jgi:hypothetical protein
MIKIDVLNNRIILNKLISFYLNKCIKMVDINTTFLNWIKYVIDESEYTIDDIIYIRTIWKELIPKNFNKLCMDIIKRMKGMRIIRKDIENREVIFEYNGNRYIHLKIGEDERGESEIRINVKESYL